MVKKEIKMTIKEYLKSIDYDFIKEMDDKIQTHDKKLNEELRLFQAEHKKVKDSGK